MKKTLQSIYENMGTPKVEEIVKESGTFSKFDLLDYTELIDEARGHGDEKEIKRVIKYATDRGLIKPFPKELKKGGWLLQSAVDNTQNPTHKGESGLKPLLVWIAKLEEIKNSRR